MSLGSEISEEMAIDYEVYESVNIQRMKRGVWVMRDGTKISLSDMSASHIWNCIRMLERNEEKDDIAQMWIDTFFEEIKRRNLFVFA